LCFVKTFFGGKPVCPFLIPHRPFLLIYNAESVLQRSSSGLQPCWRGQLIRGFGGFSFPLSDCIIAQVLRFVNTFFKEEEFFLFLFSIEVSQNLIGFGVPNGGVISAYSLAEVASLAVSLISGLATIHAPALPAFALGENSNFVHFCYLLFFILITL
jgi:hypothetical protein